MLPSLAHVGFEQAKAPSIPLCKIQLINQQKQLQRAACAARRSEECKLLTELLAELEKHCTKTELLVSALLKKMMGVVKLAISAITSLVKLLVRSTVASAGVLTSGFEGQGELGAVVDELLNGSLRIVLEAAAQKVPFIAGFGMHKLLSLAVYGMIRLGIARLERTVVNSAAELEKLLQVWESNVHSVVDHFDGAAEDVEMRKAASVVKKFVKGADGEFLLQRGGLGQLDEMRLTPVSSRKR